MLYLVWNASYASFSYPRITYAYTRSGNLCVLHSLLIFKSDQDNQKGETSVYLIGCQLSLLPVSTHRCKLS
uniref:Uncharacterized protein n=1 Tax=Arundo donax TaxID=35708 RepID=A0A0A9C0G1_ARUDO